MFLSVWSDLIFFLNLIVSSFMLVRMSSSRAGGDICKLFSSSSSLVGSSDRSVPIVLLRVVVLSFVFQLGIDVLMACNSSWRDSLTLNKLNCSSVF